MNCPECKGNLKTKGSETYCTACGLVVDDEKLDSDDRTFTDSGAILSRANCGASTYLYPFSHTEIPKLKKRKI